MRALLLLLLAAPAHAGMSFGLGKAAAKVATRAIEKAGEIQPQYDFFTGRWGTITFTSPPVAVAQSTYVISLGWLNPPGHTIPTPHIYFYYIDPSSQAPGKWNVSYPVVMPGDGYIYGVLKYMEAGALQYKLFIKHTENFSSYLDHICALDPSLEAQLGSLSLGNNTVWIFVGAGQALGTVGGVPGEMAVDQGVTNDEVTQAFIDSSHYGSMVHTDSPLKYYAAGVQSAVYAKVWRQTPDHLGSSDKDGYVCFDVPGAVAGNWAAQGSESNWLMPASWDQQLAIVYDPVYAAQIRVVFGGKHGSESFGLLGRWAVQDGAAPPSTLTVAGGAYGYQVWGWDPNNGQKSGGAPIGLFKVQLLDATTLKAEYFSPYPGTDSPAFTAAARLFTR